MAAARGILNIMQPAQKSNRKFVEYYLLTFSRKCVIIISEREGNTMNEMYNELKHYGEIIADKNHETTEGHFIRFTTFKYREMYYIVVMADGILLAISEHNDVYKLVK